MVIGLAVGLAMDAFAVSIAAGTLYREMRIRHSLRMAAFFGGFQALMPIVGWAAGEQFAAYIEPWAHLAAGGILAIVGIKMLIEAYEIGQVEKNINPESLMVVLALAVATSIDALAVGLTLSLVTDYVFAAAAVIGAVTFVLSWLGCLVGQKAGHCLEIKLEVFGAVLLLLIAFKIAGGPYLPWL